MPHLKFAYHVRPITKSSFQQGQARGSPKSVCPCAKFLELGFIVWDTTPSAYFAFCNGFLECFQLFLQRCPSEDDCGAVVRPSTHSGIFAFPLNANHCSHQAKRRVWNPRWIVTGRKLKLIFIVHFHLTKINWFRCAVGRFSLNHPRPTLCACWTTPYKHSKVTHFPSSSGPLKGPGRTMQLAAASYVENRY